MIRISLLFLLVLCPLATVSTQTPTPAAPVKRKFDYPGKVETTYDKSKDETMVFFKLLRISAGDELEWEGISTTSDERLLFSLYFTHPGKKVVTPPKWIGIGMASAVYQPKQYDDYSLTIFVDGKSLSSVNMTHHDRGETRFNAGRTPVKNQLLEAFILYDHLLQMAGAKKVMLRIGHKEIPLDKANLEAIRDLASHTVP